MFPQLRINDMSNASKKLKFLRWHNDGVNGGRSSHDIILDWLRDPQNFRRFKGGMKSGHSKTSCYIEINQIMIQEHITWRQVETIKSYIAGLERKYGKTVEWRKKSYDTIKEHHKQQGILEEQSEYLINEKLSSMCPFYKAFDEITKAYANAYPPLSTSTERDDDLTPITINSVVDVDEPNRNLESNVVPERTLKRSRMSAEELMINTMKSSDELAWKKLALDEKMLESEIKFKEQELELKRQEMKIKRVETQINLTKALLSLGKTPEEVIRLVERAFE
ncbi:hypothetical protein EDC96DRAFT_492792 [Choanephora cucurbitarum]|nr:hypothetical protein EDC96DRAFT_492792 [Choanephora cucurbitarum]